MLRLFAALVVTLSAAAPAAAQELLGGYFAMIGPGDMRNSKGAPLRNFCAIIQQDRANVQKFGIVDEYDEFDPWFTTLANRKKISADCRVGAGSEYIPASILRGEGRFVRVQVYGAGGTPQFVIVHEGAG